MEVAGDRRSPKESMTTTATLHPRDIGRAGGRPCSLPPRPDSRFRHRRCRLRCLLGRRRLRHHPPPPDRPIPRFLASIARLLGVVDNKI